MLGVLDSVKGLGSCPDLAVMLSQSDSKPPPHPLNVPAGYDINVGSEDIRRYQETSEDT